ALAASHCWISCDSLPSPRTRCWWGSPSLTLDCFCTRWPPSRRGRRPPGWWVTTSRPTSGLPPRSGSPPAGSRRGVVPPLPRAWPHGGSRGSPTCRRSWPDMHSLILAGGEGSRLAARRIAEPKALVPIGGVPQLLRLARVLERVGAESITCLVRRGVSL